MDTVLNQIRVNCTKRVIAGNVRSVADHTVPKPGAISPYGHHYVEGSAGHESILESHANSGVNALIYIGVVLLLYIIFMTFIVMRYVLMKSHSKQQQTTTPYYFGGGAQGRNFGGTTTTTANTTMGGASVSGYPGGAGGPTSVYIEGDETPPEIKFIETEL
ncbi:unnamed protein product [Medioppia subpectinata]|uniref:Uncharacterized protein n=1 Tax=Medioppia subpectinata TaxID=1979941 RepID=A0A7R9LCI3_9ACAR|nr:unnamed protein product [Medioppia subpectinata]CAG2117701.1 unnamed protein product [Medioppia subpectinata]